MHSSSETHLDQVLAQATSGRFPAVVLHIRYRGEVLYEQAAGWLDAETRCRPTQLDTCFDLASLTKLFTATAFLRLVAAEDVKLDTRVAQVLPEFTGLRPIQPYEDPLNPGEWIVIRGKWRVTSGEWEVESSLHGPEGTDWVDADGVTFRHLLAHNSGLAAVVSATAKCDPRNGLEHVLCLSRQRHRAL